MSAKHLALAAFASALWNGPALAGLNVIEFDEETGSNGTNSNQSVGWQFDVLEPITVQALTWFDEDQDGLSVAHETGIWNPAGTLLVSVVIPAGTAADLRGVWRSVPVSPVVLTPGNGYIVGGFNGSPLTDRLAFNVVHTFVHPSINYVDATFSGINGIFERPTSFSGAETGFYGPSFQLSLGPEPLVVDLDIKPGSCPNSYNRNSHGVLPVALVGTDSFDVNEVDLGSLLLVRKDGGGDPGSVAPNFGPPGPHPTIDDVATPFTGEDQCDCHELTGDGIDDLMLHFRTDDVVANLDLNDFAPGAFVSLTLVGELNDGTLFEADDCVRLVPPGIPLGLLAVTSNLPGAWIDLTPPDNTIDQGGFANFVRNYPLTTEVTLTAPSAQLGWVFVGWNLVTATGPFGSKSPVETGDAVDPLIRSRSITLPIESALEVVEAVYEPGTMPEPGDGPDPSNAPPTSHRRDDGIDDGPNDPTDDPPSSPGVPRR